MRAIKKAFLFLFITLLITTFHGSVFADTQFAEQGFFPPKMVDGVYPHHYRPDRTVDFEHLRLSIKVFMNEQRIEGTAEYTLKPIHDAVTSIRLDAHEMNIQSVTASAPNLDWNYSENSLYVTFPKPLPTDSSTSLSIVYSSTSPYIGGKYGSGMHFTDSHHVVPQTVDQVYTIVEPFGASSWFPCGDYPDDRLQTEILATVPKQFVTLSNGKLLDSTENGEWRTDHWAQKIPHATYLVSLVIGNFDIVRDEWHGKPVEYYVEKGLEKDARPSMGKTPDMIDFFSNYLDIPYPYEKYAQVAVRYFTAGGMEHTTATTMLQWIVLDKSARLDTDEEGLIMHELSHQWFGDYVTCKSWSQLWLNESFATLSDALWDEFSKGKDAYLEAMLDKMEGYISSSRSYTRAIVTNDFADPDEMFDSHSYPKGASVLHMLRQQLGDKLFRKSLHLYLQKHAPGLVDTDDLMESIEEATGKPMDRFFEQWIFSPGHPKLKITHEWLQDKKQVKVTILQTQKMKEGAAAFAFPLDIEVRIPGKTIEKTIQISKKEETAFVDCPEAPKSVEIDPDLKVLKELDYKKPIDMLLYDLKNGSTIIVRIRAARALADHRKPEVLDALFDAIQNDSYLRVRTEAIKTLAKDRSPETRNRLLKFIDNPDAKIRRAIVNALDGFYKEKKVIHALVQRIKTDPSSNVVADSIRVLSQLKPEKENKLLEAQLQRESWSNRIRLAALNALVTLKDKDAYPDFVTYSKDPNPRGVRTNAIRNLGKLAGDTKTNEEETLDLLLEYLKSKSDSIRRAAISGLKSLGSKDAIDQLNWIKANDEEESIRNAAKDAVTSIYKDQGEDLPGKNAEQLDSLKGDTQKLKDQIKELEDKLKDLTKKQETMEESK